MRPTSLLARTFPGALAVLFPVLAMAKPPTLDRVFPPGGQRGKTVEVSAEGKIEAWPVKVWVQGEGIEIQPGKEKGKLSVSIAEDATPGVRWVRLYDEEGASELRPFVVGNLAEVVEKEPNDEPSGAQEVEPACVTVNGRLAKNEDVDGFAVSLDEGQTLVASVEASRLLGSPMDGVLQVARPDGLVLAQDDDTGGLDPRLVFVAPEAGTYVVRTFAFPATPTSSIRFAGGEDFVYRLTLTTGGFADYGVPLAVSRENPGWVGVIGWNLPDEARALAVSARETDPETGIANHPALAAPVEVRVVGRPVALERAMPGEEAQSVEAPVSLTGRIAAKGERDVYRFRAEKGQALRIRVASRSLGFPLDPVVRVLGADGKELAESDDADRALRDTEVRFKPPADGEYRVEVRDLNGRGGSRFVYRLDVLKPEPDVAVSLKSDRLSLTPGKALEVAVAVERQDGFDGKLTISVEGLPEGVSAEPCTSEAKGKTAKAATLVLKSESGPAWSGPIRIVAVADSLSSGRVAQAPIEGLEATTGQPWLTVLAAGEPEAKTSEKTGEK